MTKTESGSSWRSAQASFWNNDERFIRNASIINQDSINKYGAVIIGVGAIGSHLAEMLAKMGVKNFTLIDFDEVDEINLSVQGFSESQVGLLKVEAVKKRLTEIRKDIVCSVFNSRYERRMVPENSIVFSCVDSIDTRARILRDFVISKWALLIDGRMSSESFRSFLVEKEDIEEYSKTLFPAKDAYREGCTSRATIYCANMAAAVMCVQMKQYVMGQDLRKQVHFDILGLDIF